MVMNRWFQDLKSHILFLWRIFLRLDSSSSCCANCNLLFLTSLLFGGGCLSLVFSKAMAAAACWAFLIEGPDAMYSSVSPNLRHTVNSFLWGGPASSVKRYWCCILLYLASSFIKHMGVFSAKKAINNHRKYRVSTTGQY